MKFVFLSLLLFAQPTWAGMDMPKIYLACQNQVTARFYDFTVDGAPIAQFIHMSVQQGPETQVLTSVQGARGSRKIEIEELNPWCERGFAEKSAGNWVFRSICEGVPREFSCSFELK